MGNDKIIAPLSIISFSISDFTIACQNLHLMKLLYSTKNRIMKTIEETLCKFSIVVDLKNTLSQLFMVINKNSCICNVFMVLFF